MDIIEIGQLGAGGLILDRPKFDLAPHLFSGGYDIDFDFQGVTPAVKEIGVFSSLEATPLYIEMANGNQDSVYPVYLTDTAGYVIQGAEHFNITRSVIQGGAYNASMTNLWNGGYFHGYYIWTNGADVPQVWSPQNQTAIMSNLQNWPAGWRVAVMRPFLNFLVGFSFNNGAGFYDQQTLVWSDVCDPGALPKSWEILPTTRAGIFSLTATSDKIITAEQLGSELFIYKEDSVWTMRFVGGQGVFAFDTRFNDRGVLNQRCVVQVGRMHFCVDKNMFYTHNGTTVTPVGIGEVCDFFYKDLNQTAKKRIFVEHEESRRRIWIFYPSGTSSYANKVLIWDYVKGTWTFRSIAEAICATRGYMESYGSLGSYDDFSASWASDSQPWQSDPLSWAAVLTYDSLPLSVTYDDQAVSGVERSIHYASYVNVTEVTYDAPTNTSSYKGVTWSGNALYPPLYYVPNTGIRKDGYVERRNLAIIGKDQAGQPTVDRTLIKHITELWPELNDGVAEIRVGTQTFFEGPVTWEEWVLYDPSIDIKIDPNVSEKFIAVAFRSAPNTQAPWVLAGYGLNVSVAGRY
jgi:hypothetical protein